MPETFTPQILYTEQMSYPQPLKGTKYVEGLNTELIFGEPTEKDKKYLTEKELEDVKKRTTEKACAENLDYMLLNYLYDHDRRSYDRIKDCYLNALGDGIYEAATCIGVMIACREEDDERALQFFDIAIRHGDRYAMCDKTRLLFHINKPLMVKHLFDMENHDPQDFECLYDLAVVLVQAPDHKEENIAHAKGILRGIIGNEENIEKTDPRLSDNAKEFLKYINNNF